MLAVHFSVDECDHIGTQCISELRADRLVHTRITKCAEVATEHDCDPWPLLWRGCAELIITKVDAIRNGGVRHFVISVAY